MPTAPVYEIRRSGEVLCRSTVPALGYAPDTLKDMERNGLHLYCDGKRVKKSHRQSWNL